MTYEKILVWITVLVFSSCIKEERGECPCLLSLMIDGTEFLNGEDSVSVKMTARNYELSEQIGTDVREVKYKVPKSGMTISISNGIRNSVLGGDSLVIPVGFDADKFYADVAFVDISEETAVCHMKAKKQYSVIRLELLGSEDGEYPFGIKVTGQVSGWNIRSLLPIDGKFEAEASKDSEGRYHVIVPRQKDNSMIMDLTDRKAGSVEKRFLLGEMIAETGFDWNKDELDDIVVYIDHVSARISVEIVPWEGHMTDVEI